MQQQNKKPVTQHAMRPRKVMVPEQQKQQQQNKNPIIQLATTQQPIKQVKYLMVPRQEKQQQQQNTQQIEKPQTIKPVKKMVPMQQQKQQPNKKPAIQITTTQQPIKPKSQQPKSQQHLKAVNFVMEPQQQLDGAPVLTGKLQFLNLILLRTFAFLKRPELEVLNKICFSVRSHDTNLFLD